MQNRLVTLEVHDGIGVVTLNNPPLNLVTLGLTRELNRVLDAAASDRLVRALVVVGAGSRAFCAGSDIGEFPALTAPGAAVEQKLEYENETYSKLDEFPKPTIAAVEGLAYGGGLELAVSCDLVVITEDTRLALPEIKLGVFPGTGGTLRVTRRIGEGRAKEMMFFGEPIDASTALSWGLANRVVAVGKSLQVTLAMAAVLATRPNVALQLCKRAIDYSFDMPAGEALDRTLELSDAAFQSADCVEGVAAFMEKRTPSFMHS